MNNNDNKKVIKGMLQYASTQSGISYLDLLNDITTIQDLVSDLELTSEEVITITNELQEEHTQELKKERILNAIISNDMSECINNFNKNLEDKNDINKIDLFWLEQLKLEISNTIIRVKEFNKL